ncbi:MAG: flagellar biosynthetic protein FliR [Pseudomonadota bacterium]
MSLTDLGVMNVFAFFAIFARVGTIMMTIPAFGDQSLNPQIRMGAAFAVSAAMFPFASRYYGMPPETVLGLVGVVVGEILVGLFIGVTARILLSALNIAGQMISMQTGLAMAQAMDPTQQTQGAMIGSFLTILGVTMIFATDLHHVMLAAMRDSYILFAPGTFLSFPDISEIALTAFAGAFRLGLQLAAPFFVFGLCFYLGIGLLSRLMPQVQIFFIAMPANILLGFLLLMLLLSLIMTAFLTAYEAFLVQFLA